MNRIQFKKPDFAKLTGHHTAVDLHFHSKYSDGKDGIAAIAGRACELGIGVAITGHNEIRGAIEIGNWPEMFSIPGIEITSKEGSHLLVYFYDFQSLEAFYLREIESCLGNELMSSISLPVDEIIDRARKYETVIMFPHPYCAAYTGIYNAFCRKDRLIVFWILRMVSK